jgi:serine/threonine protein kinase
MLRWEVIMGIQLQVVAGPSQGKAFPLHPGMKVVIGRGDTVHIKLADPTVSRAHCVIDWVDNKPVLKDGGSKTGTRVNGKAITEHPLLPGEVFNIGTSQLRYHVDTPPPPQEAPDAPDDLTTPEELCDLADTKLGHYEIGEVVAVGKSGTVFQARDVKDKRLVALKVYVPEFAQSEEDLLRFIRAVKTMLPKRHTNLVTLYGGGKTGPYCWMAMEYVDGTDLEATINKMVKKDRLQWRIGLCMSLGICKGLHYIHSEQIVHRNLTPGNILVNKDGVAKLGSVILAKAMSGVHAKDVTVGGELLGDVRFLSPEQAGGGGPVDVRADIYALGAVMYNVLTGKPPFETKSPLSTVKWILEKEPVPPKEADPSIPDVLDKIVMKTLAKDREKRFQTAAELLRALEQIPTA